MSHYYEQWCSVHGDYDADVDRSFECPECEKAGVLPWQRLPIFEAERDDLRRQLAAEKERTSKPTIENEQFIQSMNAAITAERERTNLAVAMALREIRFAIKPFADCVNNSSGRIPIERLSLHDWHKLTSAYNAAIPADTLEKLEALERDAARYRYLRDANGLYGISGFKGFTKPRGHPEREGEIDAAIDASAGKGQ